MGDVLWYFIFYFLKIPYPWVETCSLGGKQNKTKTKTYHSNSKESGFVGNLKENKPSRSGFAIGRSWGCAIEGEAGFLGGSTAKNSPPKQRLEFYPWVSKIPWVEKEMAAHSSILAWEIPRTEEPGGYNPWGHKRVGHNEATEQQQQG